MVWNSSLKCITFQCDVWSMISHALFAIIILCQTVLSSFLVYLTSKQALRRSCDHIMSLCHIELSLRNVISKYPRGGRWGLSVLGDNIRYLYLRTYQRDEIMIIHYGQNQIRRQYFPLVITARDPHRSEFFNRPELYPIGYIWWIYLLPLLTIYSTPLVLQWPLKCVNRSICTRVNNVLYDD